MGNDLAEIIHVLWGEGNDVALAQRARVDLLDQHQIARGKIRGAHGVRQDDKRFVAEQVPVRPVKGVDRNNGKDHHADRYQYDHPCKDGLDYIPNFFHAANPFLGNFQ